MQHGLLRYYVAKVIESSKANPGEPFHTLKIRGDFVSAATPERAQDIFNPEGNREATLRIPKSIPLYRLRPGTEVCITTTNHQNTALTVGARAFNIYLGPHPLVVSCRLIQSRLRDLVQDPSIRSLRSVFGFPNDPPPGSGGDHNHVAGANNVENPERPSTVTAPAPRHGKPQS